jgi:hypothetical protein
MGHRGIEAGARKRVEVTLRGLRFTDHPENPAEVRGVVVPWERIDFARHCTLYRADGTALGVKGLRLFLREHDKGPVRRARERRWQRLMESGELDVTERFDWVRGEIRQIAGVLGVCAALMGVALWKSPLKWEEIGDTLPGFAWIEWLVVALVGGMLLCLFGVIAKQAIDLGRVRARAVRTSGDLIEVTDRYGATTCFLWSDLKSIKRGERTDRLYFADGRSVGVPFGRLRPVIRWQRERVTPLTMGAARARAWRSAGVCFGVSIGAGLFAAVVVGRMPDPEPQQTPLGAFGMVAGMGAVLSALLWWNAIGEARRWRRRGRAASACP